MSLDVYLIDMCDHCKRGPRLFEANVTHNLNKMAEEAGIYMQLWRPDEIGAVKARDIVDAVRAGLALLRSDPVRFEALCPPNRWGSYAGFVSWVARYLEALEAYPDATIEVSR